MTDVQPVVIIGAARSGTNILRDCLTQLTGVGTWPCDEINYIWRHGNVRVPHEEFSPDMARAEVKAFIREAFAKQAEKQDLSYVVEKTCANSLRVGFVHEVVPEAKFIFIVRNGIDVTASAKKRWHAELDLPYVLKKARYIPLADVPYYGIRYARNLWYRFTSSEGRLAMWGPKFKGMTEALEQHSLAEVCALQWQRSVERAEEDLSQLPAEQVCCIDYETFVSQPQQVLEHVTTFLGINVDADTLASISSSVFGGSVGKGAKDLTDDELQAVKALLAPTLQRYGY